MLKKLVANGAVLGWSAFWIFGFLAVAAPADGWTPVYALLAFLGFLVGMVCRLRLMRAAEDPQAPGGLSS